MPFSPFRSFLLPLAAVVVVVVVQVLCFHSYGYPRLSCSRTPSCSVLCCCVVVVVQVVVHACTVAVLVAILAQHPVLHPFPLLSAHSIPLAQRLYPAHHIPLPIHARLWQGVVGGGLLWAGWAARSCCCVFAFGLR